MLLSYCPAEQTLNSSDISFVFPVFSLKLSKLLNKTIIFYLNYCIFVSLEKIAGFLYVKEMQRIEDFEGYG